MWRRNVCKVFPAVTVVVALFLAPGSSARAQADPSDPGHLDRELARSIGPPHMPESDRALIDKVIVVSGRGEASGEVDGTYGKATLGIPGGMEAGRRMGTISKEVGGVPIYFPIPGTALPGAILGGLFGLTQEQVQAFRDRLTEDLVNAENPPLRSDGLAIDAFWEIRRREELDSHLFSTNLEIPEDADAVVYADFDELSIDVDGKDAVITTSVVARVMLADTGRNVYETKISYQDRDSLSNWTENDNAAWRSYQNFARFYLGRAVAADLFNRIEVGRRLRPIDGEDTAFVRRNEDQHLETDSATPTLAWHYEPGEGGADAALLASHPDAALRWDLEIFDARSLVYDAKELTEPRHTLNYPLESCGQYRWSVRPVYLLDGERRFGDWMRFEYRPPKDSDNRRRRSKKREREAAAAEKAAEAARIDFGKGLMGRKVSDAHAYTQDFATLVVACDD